jgi:aryl-alcohol dehydrogenase-like predicted oxidoreductase
MLTGKISRDSRPADARLGQREMPFYKDYFTDRAFAVVDVLKECARSLETDGARTAAQLDTNLASTEVVIPAEILSRLDEVSAPPPEYPCSFIDWIQRGLDPAERR